MSLDKKKLAVIHIVKKELSLSDQEYRDRLEAITGVRSAKHLDEAGFRKLMGYFARSKYYRSQRDGITFRQRMFIHSLKEQLQWQDLHFANFLNKYYGKSDIQSFSKKDASKVIESLKNVLERKKPKRELDGGD